MSAPSTVSSNHPGTEWLIDQVAALIVSHAVTNHVSLSAAIVAVRMANHHASLAFYGPDGTRYRNLSLSDDDMTYAAVLATGLLGQ